MSENTNKYVYLKSKSVVEIRGGLSVNNGTQKKKPEAKDSKKE